VSVVPTDGEWARNLQHEFEDYMSMCWESVDGDFEEETEPFETLSGQAFCGCNVCEYREILTFLIPRIVYAYKEGLLDEE
jgi:hypothetical protein